MSTDFLKPKFIEGDCLCGPVRYHVDFPKDHDFQAASGTCQCTQDRKQTGSYFFPFHWIWLASCFKLTTPINTLKHYSASPGAQRGFCGFCGGFLYWKRTAEDNISIAIRSVDALYLVREGAGTGNDVPPGVTQRHSRTGTGSSLVFGRDQGRDG